MEARRPLLIVVVCAAVLAGCKSGTIFNKFDLKKGESITTDARQRVVINHNPNLLTRAGTVTPNRIVCTEPSPDVASVVASSVLAKLSIPDIGTGSLSESRAEALLRLAERTAAIQMLREEMYRACEAYSNGAMTGTTYTLRVNRLNDTMVTFLLGEVAGGASERSLGAIGSKSNAEASASISGFTRAIQDIDEAAGQLDAAEREYQAAETALAAEKAKPDVEQKDLDKLTVSRDSAKGKRDATRELLKGKIDTAAKSAVYETATAADGITAKPSKEIAQELRRMQSNFLDNDPLDGYVAACVVELERGGIGGINDNPAIQKYIIAMLEKLDGKPIKPDAARSLAAIDPFNRRSGLFEHCRTNLASLVELQHRNLISLKGYGMELQMTELAVRDQETRKEATKAYVGALKECMAIENDAVQTQCLETAQALQSRDPKTVIAAFADFNRSSSTASNVEVRPTVPFDLAKDELALLTAERTSMVALTLPQSPVATAEDCEEVKKEKAAKTKLLDELGATQDKLGGEAQTLINEANGKLQSSDRMTLHDLEILRTNILTERDTASDQFARNTAQAKLEAQFHEARQKFAEYEGLKIRLAAKKSELATHASAMKRAGHPY